MIKKITKNSGITLIAMIITIVVMLVLAGVSMNAIIGDNGILSNAINATTATSIAVLQEYLQELYVENYDNDTITKASSAVVGLSNISTYSGYFYNPKTDSGVGALSYVVDSEGHVLYLIKKSGLPEDIQKQLVGGDAGDGTYYDYASLNDVYGVTSDLDVYYCSNGVDSIQGITTADLDNDDPLRTVFEADSTWANLLSSSYKDSDGNVTAQSIRSVTSLTIDSTVSSLAELYNFTSLKELTIDGATLSSLDGIQNATSLYYLCFTNYSSSGSISDYSTMKYLTDLEYLYLTYSNDSQVSSVFNAMQGIDYSSLQYLGVYDGTSNVTTVDTLANLTTATQTAVNYLYLYNNKLTDVSCVKNFSNVIEFYCYSNSIRTLTPACSDMNNLVYLYAYSNKLGADESEDEKNANTDALASLEGKSYLSYLRLQDNSLIYTGYLSNFSSFTYLYLVGNSNLNTDDLVSIRNVYWASTNRSIDSKYALIMNTEEVIIYSSMNLTDDSTEIKALSGNTNCKKLDLSGNADLTNDTLQNILSTMTGIQCLKLNGITKLTSIAFVKNMPDLREIYLSDTAVTDLEALNNASKLYNLGLNTDIDLSCITSVINNFKSNSSSYCSSYSFGSMKGCCFSSAATWARLGDCSDLTSLYCYAIGCDTLSGTVDLRSTKLTYFSVTTVGKLNFLLPSSLESFYFGWNGAGTHFDASLCTKITSFATGVGIPQSEVEETLKSIATIPNLNSLTIQGSYWNDLSAFEDYSFPYLTELKFSDDTWGSRYCYEDISDLVSLSDTIEILYFGKTSYNGGTNWDSLSKFTHLKKLTITDQSISSLDFVSNLTNLETLTITGCAVNSCVPLIGNTSLKYLDLTNNILYNTSLGYNNLQILANLNANANNGGQLTALYLSGNEYLSDSDYAYVQAYTWSGGCDF